MRAILTIIMLALTASGSYGQMRKVQNRPYIDLRPMHFGISIGLNLQDVELQNVGPQLLESGETRTVVVDADTWNPGFSVGVLADMRLGDHFNVRISPMLHFGSKHLTFRDFDNLNDAGHPQLTTQDMKNTYISIPLDLKFSAQRFNNYRPYMIAGVSPMLNLTGKDQDFIHLKRFDTMIEVGLGCDYYLPFFKLIPELKFCYSLTDALDRNHINELSDINKRVFAMSAVKAAPTKMFLLTLYFE
jgi:hypothetical protein